MWTAADLWARWGKRRAFSPACPWETALARSGGYRRSRLSTNSQRPSAIGLRRLCNGRCGSVEVGFVRCLPPERLVRAASVVPVEEFDQAALLLKPIGCRVQVNPLVLHRPPQPLDEDVIMATTASVHADLDPMIQQHPGEFLARELRTLVGIHNSGILPSTRALRSPFTIRTTRTQASRPL